MNSPFTPPKAVTMPGGMGGSFSLVILPTVLTTSRDFVPSWDYRHRFLSGNRPEVTKSTCGKWMWRGCLEPHGFKFGSGQLNLQGIPAKSKDFNEKYELSCGDLGCPVCYEKAAGKQARKMAHRIKQFRWKAHIEATLKKDPDFVSEFYMRDPARIYHWVVSPSGKDISKLDLDRLWKKSHVIAKMAGIQGGSSMFHHLRGYNEDDLKEDIAAGSSWKTAPAAWYLSPHFHVIGVGFTSEKKVRHMNEETGWVVVNLGERNSVRSTALYQLSHAYVPEKGHAIRWFGVMAYNKLKGKPLPLDEHFCPGCGREFRKIRYVSVEAEKIVRSIVTGDGIYRLDHGLFEYLVEVTPPWS
ncbi:hypothetical protein ES705_33258 [subsurface metagenome]